MRSTDGQNYKNILDNTLQALKNYQKILFFSLHLSEGVAHIQGKTIIRDQHHR